MSLLDDNILEETDMILGFPDKEDYVCNPIMKKFKIQDKNKTYNLINPREIDYYFCYYDITNILFKSKSYSPYGLKIAAIVIPNQGITLHITAIDNMKLTGPYADFELGSIRYININNIDNKSLLNDVLKNILYDFVEHIKNKPIEFLKIIETDFHFFDRLFKLQDFFEINTKYNFIV